MKAQMLFAFLTLITFSIHAFSATNRTNVGFSKGNKTEITLLDGEVTAQCRSNNHFISQQTFFCSGYLVAPVSHDYLIASGVDADKVTLVSTREDGSTRKASSRFDSTKERSKSRFNLAISTLTQRPLLKTGENKIAYEFTKDGQAVLSGDFTAVMKIAEERKCRHEFLYLPHVDCNNMAVCDEFFRRNNNCSN